MRKKIHKFPSRVLKQLLYKDTVIADGYYLPTYFEHDDISGFFPADEKGMIECRAVSIIGILKG